MCVAARGRPAASGRAPTGAIDRTTSRTSRTAITSDLSLVQRLQRRDREHHQQQRQRQLCLVQSREVEGCQPSSQRSLGQSDQLATRRAPRQTNQQGNRNTDTTVTQEQAQWFTDTFAMGRANVDKAVLGKEHVIRLALDLHASEGTCCSRIPGHGQDPTRLRALRSTVQGRTAASSSPRPAPERCHRCDDLRPEREEVRVPQGSGSSPRSSRRRDQPASPRPSRRCSRSWRRAKVTVDGVRPSR